ncbi:MAG: ParB-like protein [Candidatus Altiarchaeota archaeon]
MRQKRKDRYVIPDPSTPERVEEIRRTYEEMFGVSISVKHTKLAVSELNPTQTELDADELEERRLQVGEGSEEQIIVLEALSRSKMPGRLIFFVLDGHHRLRSYKEKGVEETIVYLLEPENLLKTNLPEHLDIMQLPVVKRS